MKTNLLLATVIAISATSLHAQSFNVDVGVADKPSDNYAAAGLPGYWNAVRLQHVTPFMITPHPQAEPLRDINGNATNVVVHQFGGMDLNSSDDPATIGNDAGLMDDFLATHSLSLETCVYINGLEPGEYEVITYAWMPNSPSTDGKVRFDFNSYQPLVGGEWPGGHVEGITFSRHQLTVTESGSLSYIGLHVGIPSGGNTTIGAALNGFQLRKLPPFVAADMNCDQQVDGSDVAGFVTALLDEDQYRASEPTCNIDHGDLSGNGVVGPEDINAFVNTVLH